MPVTSILGILISFGMMLFLPLATWIRLFVWLAVGMVIYFSYSRFRSKLQLGESVSKKVAALSDVPDVLTGDASAQIPES